MIARPPVILVHGINNDRTNWQTFAEGLRAKGQPYATVDHGNAASPWYRGRGTVEGAATRLRDKIYSVLQSIRTGQPWLVGELVGGSGWDAPFTVYSAIGPLAGKRVDVVAHSYGGVIARWLVADHNSESSKSVDWYLRRSLSGIDNAPQPGKDGRNMVRKLITLGSQWRGTPLLNALNEVSATNNPGLIGGGFGDAPVTGPGAAFGDNLREMIRNLRIPAWVPFLPTVPPPLEDERFPAWQVMAVESPWLRYLNLGVFPNSSNLIDKSNFPFRKSMGYASLAGDNSDYGASANAGINMFGKYDDWQQPSWFPYLRLEEAVGMQWNYSDGLVPVWSAAVPGSYKIMNLNHTDLARDASAINQVLLWINTKDLPDGAFLNEQWNNPSDATAVKALGDSYRWMFPNGQMGPTPQGVTYAAGEAREFPQGNVAGALRYMGRLNRTYASGDYLNPKFDVLSPTASSISVQFYAGARITKISCQVFRASDSVQVSGQAQEILSPPTLPGLVTKDFSLHTPLPSGTYYVLVTWTSQNAGHGAGVATCTIQSKTFSRP